MSYKFVYIHGTPVYMYINMYVVPHFVCPLKTMNDEPICTVYAVNCANFECDIDFEEVK
jgi:hypothetical protein